MATFWNAREVVFCVPIHHRLLGSTGTADCFAGEALERINESRWLNRSIQFLVKSR